MKPSSPAIKEPNFKEHYDVSSRLLKSLIHSRILKASTVPTRGKEASIACNPYQKRDL
jgi:hypothetical protein